MSLRQLGLKKSFQTSIQSLLTALSKEDVRGAFSLYSNAEKEMLYRLLIQVAKALHENLAEEFEFRCQESQVYTTFDKIELLVEEQKLDPLHTDETNIREVKEKLSTAKMDEIKYLKNLLQKVEEQNNSMEAQLQSLKKSLDTTEAMSTVEKLRSWNTMLQRTSYIL